MGNVRRILLVITTVMAILAATVGVAGAGWSRALSDLTIDSNDVKVCTDQITISSVFGAQPFFMTANFPTYVPTLGAPYPGGGDAVALFATQADADANANPVATVPVALTQTALPDPADPDPRHVFSGTGTIATPAAFATNGAQVFVRARDQTGTLVGFPLTVGGTSTNGTSYNCAPTTTPLPFGISLSRDRVRIPSRFPSLIWFNPAGVNTSTLQVAANNGSPTPAQYLGTYFGRAYALVSLANAGVNCASTSIVLTASGTGGASYQGSRPVIPFGSC